MRPFSLLLVIAVLTSVNATAQTRAPSPRPAGAVVPKLGVGPASPSALAAMLAGPGVTIANATFTGAAVAAGTFAGAQASVGIDSGVVLSTGDARDAAGPNDDTARSGDNEQPGDAALDALVAPYATFDAAALEFDVTPAAATLAIRFVFGSEEYPEFIGSEYNDALAIYVNGVNCANHGGRPVSVNTINAAVNASMFIDNDSGVRDTQMDGLTQPIECVAKVNPGVPNHVRIAIADTGDPSNDSVVFLAAGGVFSPGTGAPTLSSLAKVIEYRHAEWDHYFITALPEEIRKLDDGTFVGWARTGQAFDVFVSGTPGTAEVCRFLSTSFAPKSSHFYTPSASECELVKKNPDWQFEGAVLNVTPVGGDGACPAGTQQLFRVYNDGQGGVPNHRYTTDHDTFLVMQQLGWKPEGYGEGVIACVPI